MTKFDYGVLVEQCDQDLRLNRIQAVNERLNTISFASVPREWRLPLAHLCRRAELWRLGLELLTPIVRGDRHLNEPPATIQESAVYAMILFKYGSTNEARKILAGLDSSRDFEVHLFRGFCAMGQWSYLEAISELTAYIKSAPDDYRKFVAGVNLTAALLGARKMDGLLEILDDTVERNRVAGNHRLLGNSLELRAQYFLLREEFNKAETDLSEAVSIFTSLNISDQLFVVKWRSFAEALKSKNTAPIFHFRQIATERGHWESVRDSDFHLLKVAFDEKKFHHLIYGTPFESFRQRACNELGRKPSWPVYLHGTVGGRVIDLSTGIFSDGGGFKPGQQAHRLLDVLLRDLYRPLPLGTLFASLFPGDYFDIFSSPDRVHQCLWRCRQQFKKMGLPLSVIESDGGYRIEVTGSIAFAIHESRADVSDPQAQLNWILNQLGHPREFYLDDVKSINGLTENQWKKSLAWAVNEGLLQRINAGIYTRYMVISTLQKAK